MLTALIYHLGFFVLFPRENPPSSHTLGLIIITLQSEPVIQVTYLFSPFHGTHLIIFWITFNKSRTIFYPFLEELEG